MDSELKRPKYTEIKLSNYGTIFPDYNAKQLLEMLMRINRTMPKVPHKRSAKESAMRIFKRKRAKAARKINRKNTSKKYK